MNFRLLPRALAFTAVCLSFLLHSAQAQEKTDEDSASNSNRQASSAAQKLYSAAKNDLLQIRVLVKNGRTQSSVGSGFMVGQSDLVVTNYHVVSQIALEPEVYVGEFVDTNDQRGTVELLAVDVLHDLAVVRISRRGTGFFQIPEDSAQLPKLNQGQYLYSLGNPLDLGFAISEGAYNGIIGRAFYDQLLFTGSINSGMSGGPNVTPSGALAGVNVAKRTDGELVSFLVPARFVVELLNKVKQQKSIPSNFNEEVGRQLIVHQNLMLDKLLEHPLNNKELGPYLVPVRESEQMRCWGSSNTKEQATYTEDKISCNMESSIYVSGKLQTGHVAISHSFSKSKSLDALRFSIAMSDKFKNQIYAGNKQSNLTGPACTEEFIKNEQLSQLSMRAVICVRAYRKFAGIYDFRLITYSMDQEKEVLQSLLSAKGVSYDNGLRLTRQFLQMIGRKSVIVSNTAPATANSVKASNGSKK